MRHATGHRAPWAGLFAAGLLVAGTQKSAYDEKVVAGEEAPPRAVTEETIGPTVVINPEADLEEGVEKANATSYGLGGSIFTGDRRRGLALAEKLDVGMVSINSFLAFAGIPALPFGGSGDSGFGRILGADGLREFARPKAITAQKFSAPLNLMTMTRKPRDIKIVKWMLANVQGKL